MAMNALRGLTPGHRVSPQILGRRRSRIIVDASDIPKTRHAGTGLQLFRLDDVFSDRDAVFVGFGTPNTYTVVPREAGHESGPGWSKLAAFMFWRQKAYVPDTHGQVQSGTLYQLMDLPDESIESLRRAMNAQKDKRGPSCAHSNAMALDSAGFTCNGKRLHRIYRPSKLASLIWEYGLELHGKPVEIRVIHTDKEPGDHFYSVWRRELTSLCRSVKKKFVKSATIGSTDTADAADMSIEADRLAQIIELPQGGRPVRVGVSRPSYLGAHMGMVLGQHPIYLCEPPVTIDASELVQPLRPFPGVLDRITKLKKYVLFSPPAVSFINSHLMASKEYHDGFTTATVPTMLRASHSPNIDGAFKYNIVITGSRIYLTRLENRNGRDKKRLNWILSKHVLIANYDPDVRFSGEIWSHVVDGIITLYVTGDSGTYKPGEERLDPAVAYIASTFNVAVVGVKTR